MNKFEEHLINVLLEGESTGWSVGQTMERVGRTVGRSEQRGDKKAVAKQKPQAKRILRKLSRRRNPEDFQMGPRTEIPAGEKNKGNKNDPPDRVAVGMLDTPAWRKARGKRRYYQGKEDVGGGPGGWPETVK